MGLSRDTFWRLTVRELFQEFAIAKRRSRDVFERDTTHAYQVVRIYVETKAKQRMPSLERLLQRPMTGQSIKEMKAVMHALGQQPGFTYTDGAAHG